MYLELLVDHHTSIHSLLKHLSAFTSASILAANAEEASRAVSRLAGLLTVHLAAEDKFLYPSLARSEVRSYFMSRQAPGIDHFPSLNTLGTNQRAL